MEWISNARCEPTIVETAEECITQLESGAFDLVFLDHDLGGEIYVDSGREDCGMEVVRWLERNGGEHRRFVIHTHNEVAGAMMYFQLDRMGYSVAQVTFGSPEFRQTLEQHLGAVQAQKKPKSLRERLRLYFRSLRLGR